MEKRTISVYLDNLRRFDPDRLRTLALLSFPDAEGVYSEAELEALKMLTAAFTYIAELKTPCEPGDVNCIQHHEQNCPCLDEYRKEQENGQTV